MHVRKNKFRHPLHALIHINCHIFSFINPSAPDPGREKKINLNFYFHTLYGASRGFIKALKAFIKPLEALQGNVRKN